MGIQKKGKLKAFLQYTNSAKGLSLNHKKAPFERGFVKSSMRLSIFGVD